MEARLKRRPSGLTLLALFLFCTSFSATVNFMTLRSNTGASSLPPTSPGAQMLSSMHEPSFLATIVLFGVSALVAALAIWRMLRWMPTAFLVWSLSAILFEVIFSLKAPAQLIWGGRLAAFAFIAGLAFLLFLIYKYLSRVSRSRSYAAL